MEYTLFFSYQSDTKREYTLIKDILNNEVKKTLGKDGIELIVNDGMRGTAGNPNLLDTMLKKGEECDIFLADLTYVTNFTNSKGNKKSIPNPNVMLELGHAWNFHGNNHTIFIQNEAYGVSEDLPVDLKGFRFPVSYTLNDDTPIAPEDKKKLIKDLYKAISEVVKSIDNENKVRFYPFEKFEYSQLQKTQNQYEFIVTEYYNDIVNQLSNVLSSGRMVILSGKSGSGKSRMIKEFICSKFSAQQQNDTFYCNLLQTDIPKLCHKIKIIINELHRNSYFIVDNCDKQCIEQLNDILCGTNHKLIMITEESDIDNNIKINSEKYINGIIYAKAPNNWYEFTKQHITDVRHILAVLNNDSQYRPRKYNLGDDCKDCNNLLGYLSLFSKVGFSDNFKEEFLRLCSLFDLDEKASRNKINDLIRKGLVNNQGNFIFIESDPVAREYAKDMWKQKIVKESSFSSLSDQCNLWQSLIKRQIQIASDNNDCSMFLKNIIKVKLRKIEFVDTYQGERIVYELADQFPEEAINSLDILISENKEYKFERINSLLWAIQLIIKKKEFFDRAIQLLLKLHCKDNSINLETLVVNEFTPNNINFNKFVSVESFKSIYFAGYLDIVKKVYSSIFNIGYSSLSEQLLQYLKDMFLFLISIRADNKEWANSLIIKNILVSKYLSISRQVYGEIRKIIKENNDIENTGIAEILSDEIRWASSKNKRSITALLKQISDKNYRMTIYNKVVLNKMDRYTNREMFKSDMNKIADEILLIDNWDNYIDVLLKGGRKFDTNCYWFGYAISEKYDKCDELISRCLDLYKDIPSENQSHGFFNGLANKYVCGNDNSVLKQKRDELFKIPAYFSLAMSLSNTFNNTFDDLISIKDAIIANSRYLVLINELYFIDLSEKEYCSFASKLINISKDGADSAIKLLDRARTIYTNINISDCIVEIINRYNYWDVSDFRYDSVYSKLISLLEYTVKTNPNKKIVEKIIQYVIDGANNRNFNNNCSVVVLFQILIENYQKLFLERILPIVNDDSLKTYSKKSHLADLFAFKHTANTDVYIDWCSKNGKHAAEFVANFITVFTKGDDGNLQWTKEVKALMDKFCEDEYVLDHISTRLFNGEVSIQKYQRLKNAYDLLTGDKKTEIKIWAIKEFDFMENLIQSEQDKLERRQVWDR